MTDYQKYINALRKCSKEHENDKTFTGHIIVSDLCKDTANLLEELSSSEIPENSTTETLISLEVYKQVAWERDIAIEQLKELGYDFGEKIRTSDDKYITKIQDNKCASYYKEWGSLERAQKYIRKKMKENENKG